MAKILRCRDVGIDCDFEVRAGTEGEILKKAAEHAQTVHNMKEIAKEVIEKVCAAINPLINSFFLESLSQGFDLTMQI